MKVNQEECKNFIKEKLRKYAIDNIITRCPTNSLSMNDDDTMQ